MLLVCRFTVAEGDVPTFTARVNHALELLTRQPGCVRGVLGRSTDERRRWVLTVEFASVVAYRRALSPVDVRSAVIPLLNAAEAEPGGYEILAEAVDGTVRSLASLVAGDPDAATRPADASGTRPARGEIR